MLQSSARPTTCHPKLDLSLGLQYLYAHEIMNIWVHHVGIKAPNNNFFPPVKPSMPTAVNLFSGLQGPPAPTGRCGFNLVHWNRRRAHFRFAPCPSLVLSSVLLHLLWKALEDKKQRDQ